MQKISEHYREDDAAGLSPDIKQYLDANYLPGLKNISQPNPKLLVVFSGGNAVGKSTLSRVIEQRFKALVLENDEVKRCLLEYVSETDRTFLNKTTWQYTMQLYASLSEVTSNGLIVRDGVIDWYFDRILPVFLNQGYELFVTGFDLSEEKTRELIHNRGDTPTVKEERFYELLNDHKIHTQRFRSQYKVDIMLDDVTLFRHDLVLAAIDDKLKSIQQEL